MKTKPKIMAVKLRRKYKWNPNPSPDSYGWLAFQVTKIDRKAGFMLARDECAKHHVYRFKLCDLTTENCFELDNEWNDITKS